MNQASMKRLQRALERSEKAVGRMKQQSAEVAKINVSVRRRKVRAFNPDELKISDFKNAEKLVDILTENDTLIERSKKVLEDLSTVLYEVRDEENDPAFKRTLGKIITMILNVASSLSSRTSIDDVAVLMGMSIGEIAKAMQIRVVADE